jgi:nitrite reductase/ring-hydroxylating ferredoxin subunit
MDAPEWIDVGPREDFAPGEPTLVRVAGRRIAVVRAATTDEAAALDDACPHAGDPLSIGFAADGRIWCRSHGWTFDLRTGACTAGDPRARVNVHEARIRGGRVEVRLRA